MGACRLELEYFDKPPGDTSCGGWPCGDGPGRFQRIVADSRYSPGTVIRWSAAFTPDDVRIRISGPSHTKALPAGPALLQVITTTQGRHRYPRASVGMQINGGSFRWVATNANGEWHTNFIPASRYAETVHVKVACWSGCVNTDEKVIHVAACETCHTQGNPIAPGSGEKLQTEPDWQDAGEHPVSFTRHYRSGGAAASAGLGTHWSHGFAASITGSDTSRIVQLGDGLRVAFSRATVESPWVSDSGRDTLTESTAQASLGPVFLRASDESRWQFDSALKLQSITQRNGWVMTLGYTGGLLTSVTNAFGRRLILAYDGAGWLAFVTPPGGLPINYSYDASSRLNGAFYPDGASRLYHYEQANFPHGLTGITNEAGQRYASFGYDSWGRANYTSHAAGAGTFLVVYHTNRGSEWHDGVVDPALYRDTVRVVTPNGQNQYFEYQGGNGTVRLVSSSVPIGPDDVASRITGPGNLPLSETDFLGHVKTWTWDAARQLPLSVTEASNRPEASTTSTTWHASFRLPVQVVEAGRSTAYTYDAQSNKLSEAMTDAATGITRTTQWSYGGNGLVATMTDAKGGVWQYTHDTAGNRTSTKNPLGQETIYTYNAAGRVTSQTDANGLITGYTYDTRGRVLTQTLGGETTSYTYTPNGQVSTVTLPGGHAVSYAYDAAQRLIGATDNRGNRVTYALDAAGNRTREEVRDANNAIAKVTGRVINNLNRVTQIKGAANQTTHLGYDANGEPISQTDPLNQTTVQQLDGLRRPTATTYSDSTSASQAWNQLSQLTAVTDPKGVQTHYTTNAFGDVTSETSPDIGTVSYQHDALGNVTQQTDAKGNVTTWSRDALGRPTSVQHASGDVTTFTYDEMPAGGASQVGYLSAVEDKSGTTHYARDLHGRVTARTQTVNDNPNSPSSYTTAYSYVNGELAGITYASGLKVSYNRDVTGQITGITTQEPSANPKKPKPQLAFVTNLSWTALNQPKSWNWASGDSANRSFDADGRMSSNEFATYTYDAASRITGITQHLWATSTATGTVTSYTTPLTWTASYDSRNRLTGFSRTGSETSYSYDPNSNRLTAVDRITSDIDLDGQFDEADDFVLTTGQNLNVEGSSNRLLGINQTVTKTRAGSTRSVVTTPISYSLDANGALTSDGLRTFSYDESSRLAQVSLMKDGEAAKVTYLHNALGQRVFKSEVQVEQTLPDEEELGLGFVDWLKKNFKWLFLKASTNASVGTAYMYGDSQLPSWALLGEYDNGSATGAGRTEYIWLPTPDGAIPVGMFRNGKLFAIHADHLGTPRLMTNESNKPVWQWPYSAFGNNKPTGILKATTKPKQAMVSQPVMLKATNPQQELNLRMPGQYYDSEMGIFYNINRYFDPRTGRYSQSDPIGLDGGLNRFGYVDGNPLMFVDPDGLLPQGLVDFGAGLGDTLLFGQGKNLRDLFDVDGGINPCSTEYSVGEWAGIAGSMATGLAGGLKAAGTKGAGKEFSHWIPNRMGGPRSTWNGNFVPTATHALSDPYRYRFMPRSWKAQNPMPNAAVQQWTRVPNAYKGGAAGGAYGASGAAQSGCSCQP